MSQYGEPAFRVVKRLATRTWEGQESHLHFLETLARVAGSVNSPASQEWILETALSHVKGRNVADHVIKAWLEVLASLVPNLGAEIVKQRMIPLAVQSISHYTTNLKQRVISTVLLCACVRRFPEDEGLLEKWIAACQDTEALVRLSVVGQLPNLVRATAEYRDTASVILNEVRNHVLHRIFSSMALSLV